MSIPALQERLHEKGLTLLFAAEAGSRAWGFESRDSDFDIRFLFLRQRESYLSLFEGVQDLTWQAAPHDFAGWDIRKALRLALASNPSFIEWVQSPVTYYDAGKYQENLKALMERNFSPLRLAMHYASFMRNIKGKYLKDFTGEYTIKRYLYALRPIFVIKWMAENPYKLPLCSFDQTFAETISAGHIIRKDVATVLALKKAGKEADTSLEFPVLNTYIQEWFENINELAKGFPDRTADIEEFNSLFRGIVTGETDGKAQ